MEMNKRGQGLSTNAIILIILGVFILVILIVGFTMGWDTIAPWLSKENVDEVATSCALACNSLSEYDFCTQKRTLIDEEKNEYRNVTCHALSVIGELDKYGIEGCNALDCGITIPTSINSYANCTGHEGDTIFVTDKKVKTLVTCPTA